MIAGLPGVGLSAMYYLVLGVGMGLARLWQLARAGAARLGGSAPACAQSDK